MIADESTYVLEIFGDLLYTNHRSSFLGARRFFSCTSKIIRGSVTKSVDKPDFSEYSVPMKLIANIRRNSMRLGEVKRGVCMEAIANIASDDQSLIICIRQELFMQ